MMWTVTAHDTRIVHQTTTIAIRWIRNRIYRSAKLADVGDYIVPARVGRMGDVKGNGDMMEYTFDTTRDLREQFRLYVNTIYANAADMTFAERKQQVDNLCAAWERLNSDVPPFARDVERLGTVYLWGEFDANRRSAR